MSISAYRLIKKEVAENPSFNLWSENGLIEFLHANGEVNEYLDEGGSGTIDVSIEALKKAIEHFTFDNSSQVKALKADIASVDKDSDDETTFVIYECY